MTQRSAKPWWEGGSYDYDPGHIDGYRAYLTGSPRSIEDTIERWARSNLAPPPSGMTFTHWPPKSVKELKRSMHSRDAAIKYNQAPPAKAHPATQAFDQARVHHSDGQVDDVNAPDDLAEQIELRTWVTGDQIVFGAKDPEDDDEPTEDPE